MTTVVRTGMIEDGAFYTQAEAYALFRSIFVGSYADFAYVPSEDDEPWWLPCFGQTLLTADYPALFAKLGATYGGNGTTTFGLPDWRGRVGAGLDNMGGTSANRLTNQTGGLNGDVLGAAGGSETHTLDLTQIPAHKHDVALTAAGGHTPQIPKGSSGGGDGAQNGPASGGSISGTAVPNHNHTVTEVSKGGGLAHNNVQPTMTHVRCILAF